MDYHNTRGWGGSTTHYPCRCGCYLSSYEERCGICREFNPYYQSISYGTSGRTSGSTSNIPLGIGSIHLGNSSPKIEEPKINKLKLLLK